MSKCDKCGQYVPPTQEELDVRARRCLSDEEYATYCMMRDQMAAQMRKWRAEADR